MPPVPPGVAAQQGPPPIRQFAQGGGAPQGDQGQDPSALSAQLVDSIGKQMTQLAQILGSTKPELIPILKQGVQAMVMVAGKLKTGSGAPVAGQGGQPAAQGDNGGNQGTAADTAPDAGGPAAMGMQQ